MKLTRRNFLAWAGLSAVGGVACFRGIPEGELQVQSPVRLPEDLVRGTDNWYATLCRNCPASEGVIVRVMEGRAKKIEGNPLYPVNQGKHSARCEAGLQAVYHPDRIPGPMRRDGPRGSFRSISWEQGLDDLAAQLQAHGQNMLMVTEPLRGHLAMVVSRFANAFEGRYLGFETLDNNTYRQAVSSVFGQDILPDFDLERTRFLLSFGADFLSTWMAPTRWNIGYGEFRQGEGQERGVFYQVDPRFSMTAANADLWLPIRPGWEGHLALSLAYVILSEELQAPGVDVMALTAGRGAAALEAFQPEAVAQQGGITENLVGTDPAEFIRQLARDFAANRPSLAIGGGSAAAHRNGLFNLEAIYALNYLVGSVGVPGGVRFNPESPLEDVPAAPQVGVLSDWEQVAEELREGNIPLLLLHRADLVHGLPATLRLRDALSRDNLFIVSFSPFLDETNVMADLVLPDRVYLEDWGDDIPEPGRGYQTVGFQQPVVNPLSDLNPRSFPDVLLSVAQELGRDDVLPWQNFHQLLRQAADELFTLNRGSIQAASADEFWHTLLRQGGWWDEAATGPNEVTPPNGLLDQIAARAAEPEFTGPGPAADTFYLMPFAHNTLLDGQNAHLPWLQAAPDPLTTITWQTWVEINDRRARDLGLREGDVVMVESPLGFIRAPVYPTPAMPPDVIGVPLGQGRRSGSPYATGRPARESSNVMDVLAPNQDRDTGALAWASTRVRLLPTGESVRVSKFEGKVEAREAAIFPAERIIITITPEQQ